jgi:RNA polymerase primary sigma factor/RNA polymerase nonessential primary-like sigma factor
MTPVKATTTAHRATTTSSATSRAATAKAVAKKTPAKKTPAKKTAAAKAPAKKAVAKKAPAKKIAPTKATAVKKAPPIKATAAKKAAPVRETSAGPPPVKLTRSSAQWHELNNELFTIRGRRPRLDKDDPGSGLQEEIATLKEIPEGKRSFPQKTRLRRLEYELEKVTSQIFDLNFGLVRNYVKRFTQNASHDDVQDFEGAGALGMMKAIDSYDPSRGPFASWAYKPILREVHRAVRDADHSNINPTDFDSRPKILIAMRELQNGNESFHPDPKDIAAKAGVTVDQVNRIVNAPRLDSMSQQVGDGTSTLADLIEDKEYSVEDKVIASMTMSDIDTYGLSQLDDRELYVIVRRMGLDGEPRQRLSSIGEQLSLSREAVRQIEGKAKGKLLHPVILRKMVRAGRP